MKACPAVCEALTLLGRQRPSWAIEENGSPAGCEKERRVSLTVGKRAGPQGRPVEHPSSFLEDACSNISEFIQRERESKFGKVDVLFPILSTFLYEKFLW